MCGSVPLSPPLILCVCVEVDSCAAAAAASALRRSAEGGRPRLRRGTLDKVLSRDLRGASLVAFSLFRLVTLASPRPPLGIFASGSCGFVSLSSSVSVPNSDPACLLSSAAASLPVLQVFLLIEDGGRPLLFSPVPGGLPGSLFTFSDGLSDPSGLACVGEGWQEGDVRLATAFWTLRALGGLPRGFFS